MATLTGIDPGSSAIKIIQGHMNGPIFKVTRAIKLPIDPDADVETEILTDLQTVLPGLKLKAGTTRLGVTGRDLMIRYTTVPPVPIWRLRMLMDFEVADMASSSGDQLTADYNIVTTGSESGDETVMVALVKSHLLDGRLRALQPAKIEPTATTPNCVAIFNSFLSFGELHDDECTLILDVGDQNLEMAIQKNGELLFARNLAGGGSLFTKAIADNWKISNAKARELKEEFGNVTPRGRVTYTSGQEEKVAMAIMGVAGQLTGMVQSTMNFAKSQIGVRDLVVGRVVMSGGGSALTGLDAYLAQNLGLPVTRFVPENGLDLSALSAAEREVFEEAPSDFVAALGLARMSEDAHAFKIDLVPTATKRKRRFLQRTVWMIAAGVAASLLLVLTWFNLRTERDQSANLREQARRNERKVTQNRRSFEETAAAAEVVKTKIDRLAWESRALSWLSRSQDLVQTHAPASIWVRSIRVQTKTLQPPGADAAAKKVGVEKIVVLVEGEIQQLGEGVTASFNRFIEDLRSGPNPPLVETMRLPRDAGGDFEIQIDFAGWDAATATEEDA